MLCNEDSRDQEDKKRFSLTFSQRYVNRKSSRGRLRHFLKGNLFQGNILITTAHITNARRVNDLYLAGEGERLVYWTDASKNKDLRCGIGVVGQSSLVSWDELSWSVRASKDTYVLEIYAIAKALELDGEHCRMMGATQKQRYLCLYSDCSSALKYFLRFSRPWLG